MLLGGSGSCVMLDLKNDYNLDKSLNPGVIKVELNVMCTRCYQDTSALCELIHLTFKQPEELGAIVIATIHMRKLVHREVK